MSLVTRELLDHIQGQLDIEVSGYSVIGHGAHNQNYLLETGRGKLLLRVYANTQFKNAAKEYEVLRTIDGFLGPRAFYLDTSRSLMEYDYMVLEYIEGTVLTEFDDAALTEIAGSLKKLHGINGPNGKTRTSPVSDWTRNNIEVNSLRLGEELHREVMELWDRLMALHSQIEPYLSAYDSNSLTHDDPILGNFIPDWQRNQVHRLGAGPLQLFLYGVGRVYRGERFDATPGDDLPRRVRLRLNARGVQDNGFLQGIPRHGNRGLVYRTSGIPPWWRGGIHRRR
jgi:aminoglycoside phosphotransferase (APT) family kinase protein